MQTRRFGTVRPRGQIPGPRPVLNSKVAADDPRDRDFGIIPEPPLYFTSLGLGVSARRRPGGEFPKARRERTCDRSAGLSPDIAR